MNVAFLVFMTIMMIAGGFLAFFIHSVLWWPYLAILVFGSIGFLVVDIVQHFQAK